MMMNRTTSGDNMFCGLAEAQEPPSGEGGIDLKWVSQEHFRSAVFDGGYRQLARLGILRLASQKMRIDVFTAPSAKLDECHRVELCTVCGAQT